LKLYWCLATEVLIGCGLWGRNLIDGDGEFDAPRLPRLPANQAALFELEDYAVNCRRCHTEEGLDISLGWHAPVEQDVRVNEGQILPRLSVKRAVGEELDIETIA